MSHINELLTRPKYKVILGRYPSYGGTPVGVVVIITIMAAICFLLALATQLFALLVVPVILIVITRICNKRYESNFFYISSKRKYNYLRTDTFIHNMKNHISQNGTLKK